MFEARRAMQAAEMVEARALSFLWSLILASSRLVMSRWPSRRWMGSMLKIATPTAMSCVHQRVLYTV